MSVAMKKRVQKMRHVSSEKSSLAWFKLAEFVTRGEKERALSIFRLLSHSIKSEALAAQLEGDLLHAFQDDRALDAYRRAALLYQRENDIVQAILLYEQLSLLSPQSDDVLLTLLEWYQRLGDQRHSVDVVRRLIALFVEQQRILEAHDLVVRLPVSDEYKSQLHEQFATSLLTSTSGKAEERLIKTHVAAALDGLLHNGREERITRFLATLSAFDQAVYTFACDYVRNAKLDCNSVDDE